jgi:hypothetical protein
MRPILVIAILLLGLIGAAPEPKYSLFGDNIRAETNSLSSLVEIESQSRCHSIVTAPSLQSPQKCGDGR